MMLVDEDEAITREMIEHFSGCAQCYLVNISVLILCRTLINNVLDVEESDVDEISGKLRRQKEDHRDLQAD
jgi:hypothetical protein